MVFFFLLGILAPVSLDLDYEVERVYVPIVHQQDEVREVTPGRGAEQVRHLQAQVVILHVGRMTEG